MYLKKTVIYIFILMILLFSSCNKVKNNNKLSEEKKTVEKKIKKEKKMSKFYQYKAKDIYGKEVSMEEYKGKVVLIVNVASKCGFTPQYEGLEKLYKEYKEKGLVILGFPSDQFAHQEPGTNEEIASFCKLNYGVTFPLFTKIEVNGDNTHPIYKYLKSELSGLLGSKIKWNFTKFLIDTDGKSIKRYAPNFKPKNIEKDIKKLLK